MVEDDDLERGRVRRREEDREKNDRKGGKGH
jgi:hypothetical protein